MAFSRGLTRIFRTSAAEGNNGTVVLTVINKAACKVLLAVSVVGYKVAYRIKAKGDVGVPSATKDIKP